MRKYIRHLAGVPIEVKGPGQGAHEVCQTVNLGIGGLAFRCDREFAQGAKLEIRIPFVLPPFEAPARVAWSKPHGGGFELGVEFLNQDEAYVGRMVEQVCHFDNYRKSILRTDGRQIAAEEAAREWIGKYGAKPPGP